MSNQQQLTDDTTITPSSGNVFALAHNRSGDFSVGQLVEFLTAFA